MVYGLSVKFSQNKTEGLTVFRGLGAKADYNHLDDLEYQLQMKPASNAQQTQHLRLVTHYTHVGSVITSSIDGFLEAKRRSATTSEILSRLGLRVFRSHCVSTETKKALLRSLILPRLLYFSGTRHFKEKEVVRLNAVYMKALRDVLRAHNTAHGDHVTDSTVLEKLGMPSFMFLCRLLRTTLKMTVFLAAVSAADSASWVRWVFADLSWLYLVLPRKLSNMPHPDDSPQEWVQSIVNAPQLWG